MCDTVQTADSYPWTLSYTIVSQCGSITPPKGFTS